MDELAEVCIASFVLYVLLRHWTTDVRQTAFLAVCTGMVGVATITLGGGLSLIHI